MPSCRSLSGEEASGVSRLLMILLKNPLSRKILYFGGFNFILPIAQKRVYGHFRAPFFVAGIRFLNVGKKGGFSGIYL
jgi:hypothetical protein